MSNENIEEIFMQHGVTLKKASASYISALNTVGVLTFGRYRKDDLYYFEWKQVDVCEVLDTESQDSGWSLVDTIESTSSSPIRSEGDSAKPSEVNSVSGNETQKDPKISLTALFRDLKGVEIVKNELRFINLDLSVHSLYLFHASPHSFVDFLERKRFVRKSSRRKQFYNCVEQTDNEKMQKSFSELNIEDIRNRPRVSPYYDFMSKLTTVHHQILPLHRYQEEFRSRAGSQGADNVADRNGSELVNGKEEKRAVSEGRQLMPRPQVHRASPLDAKKWAENKSPNGAVVNSDQLKQIIFRGVSVTTSALSYGNIY